MTETVKHTPGEWKYGVRQDGSIWLSIGNPSKGPHYQGDLIASEDDARLITAVPDLLEALIMVRDADDDCKKDGLPSMQTFARAKLDAAIAKAEGRS